MNHSKSQENWIIKLILSLTLCLGGGLLAGLATQHGVKNWYPLLIKPVGTPPDLAFPIVWSILYFLMGVSLTLLLISPSKHKKFAYLFFGLQLFCNFIWSYLFFYLEEPGLALLDIVLLWLLIICSMIAFYRITKWGSLILIPYFIWVSYAFYLNLFIWLYN